LWIAGKRQYLTDIVAPDKHALIPVLFGPVKMKRYARKSVPETMEGEVSRFCFHCSDGLDLVVDREGIEVQGSDVLWWALRAAARLMNALPSYDEWSAWTVAVHNERGSLVETVPFPTHGQGSLCPEEGTDRWPQPPPANLHPTGSTRYH
jgi:hypothetical protein